MFCHGAGLRPGRLQGIAASLSVRGPDAPLPEERSPRAHNARPAARPRPRARDGGAVPSTVDVMLCHVLSCSAALAAFPSLRFVPFALPSSGPGRGPCFARSACAPARGPGRARRAQGALRPSVSPGFFPAGAKREAAAPRLPPPSSLIVACFFSSQTLVGNYFRFTEQTVFFDRQPDAALPDSHNSVRWHCIAVPSPVAPARGPG